MTACPRSIRTRRLSGSMVCSATRGSPGATRSGRPSPIHGAATASGSSRSLNSSSHLPVDLDVRVSRKFVKTTESTLAELLASVELAALKHGRAEHLAHRRTQRLGAIEHGQHRAGDIQAAFAQPDLPSQQTGELLCII